MPHLRIVVTNRSKKIFGWCQTVEWKTKAYLSARGLKFKGKASWDKLTGKIHMKVEVMGKIKTGGEYNFQ